MRSASNGFRGGLFKKNKLKKKKKKKRKEKLKKETDLHLCASLSWFKETGGLHSVRRSRVPTSFDKSPWTRALLSVKTLCQYFFLAFFP
jgi:hypothetical protein